MPELPEVETIVRVLAPELEGRRLAGHGPLTRVWRYGKCAILDFPHSRLIFRLGMTGTLRLGAEPTTYTRAQFDFEGRVLSFDDIRRFGRYFWTPGLPAIGPDVLAIEADAFAQRLVGRARPIKAALLDQAIVSGLGNIYADECLFEARIHPLIPAGDVDAGQLLLAIQQILREAIADGGSTISDFYDPFGRPGRYQHRHQVYGRAGQPCPGCGGEIVRFVAAQRGTHHCPRCQPWAPPPPESHPPGLRPSALRRHPASAAGAPPSAPRP
jgi:formamidopyrimidine-DNA glycosylase